MSTKRNMESTTQPKRCQWQRSHAVPFLDFDDSSARSEWMKPTKSQNFLTLPGQAFTTSGLLDYGIRFSVNVLS